MEGWSALTRRLLASPFDPALAAAATAFAFVCIHPFEDGDGRIHRFLIDDMLAKRGFSPPGIVLPVSAAILGQRAAYDQVLERFSNAILPSIDWVWSGDARLVVRNDSIDLYAFFDVTAQAEHLHERFAETIAVDLKDERGSWKCTMQSTGR